MLERNGLRARGVGQLFYGLCYLRLDISSATSEPGVMYGTMRETLESLPTTPWMIGLQQTFTKETVPDILGWRGIWGAKDWDFRTDPGGVKLVVSVNREFYEWRGFV